MKHSNKYNGGKIAATLALTMFAVCAGLVWAAVPTFSILATR